MSGTNVGGAAVSGSTSAQYEFTRAEILRTIVALIVLIGLGISAYGLHNTPGWGATAAFSLLVGAAIGIVFERGRFCFFCILRDYIEFGNSSAIYSILTALALGGIGYAVVFGAFMPNSMSGRLPPDAHIGPVSWALVAAGLAFGLGMALSGACISGHLYRLGEGYARAPLALFGSLIGFGLGFMSWYTLYLNGIAQAPVAWLPATFGYAGSVLIHLLVLGLLALFFMRSLPDLPLREGGRITMARLYNSLFRERWNPIATGALVAVIGTFAYFRVEPLGVTAQLGSVPRTILNDAELLAERLPGLDTFSGCATIVVQTIMDNGFLIIGLVLASFAVALLGNRFQLSSLTIPNSITALVGGVLMGWGSMIALGCTVGTLLSGISAFAISGWVFGAAVFAGVWLGIRMRLHTI